jgi:hypothetical protein
MGLFSGKGNADVDRLQKKLNSFTDAVISSFNNVKQDINLQNQWISHLHSTHSDLRNQHDSHKTLTSAELDKVKAWINHLYESSKKQEKSMEELKLRMNEAFTAYNKHIIELYKQEKRENIDIKALKEEVRRDIMPDLSKVMHEQSQLVHQMIYDHRVLTTGQIDEANKHLGLISQKIDSLPHIKEIQMVPKPSLLTYPEQKLLNFLLNEADPVTYEQVAQKTGHSINTVRVIMNSLKKRNLIEEHLLPSGIKLFNAHNKERIKKIYNIDLL